MAGARAGARSRIVTDAEWAWLVVEISTGVASSPAMTCQKLRMLRLAFRLHSRETFQLGRLKKPRFSGWKTDSSRREIGGVSSLRVNRQIVKILLRAKATLDAACAEGNSVWDSALAGAEVAVQKYLLAARGVKCPFPSLR